MTTKLATQTVGVLALLSIAATVWLGLWVTPPDAVQGELVRIIYLHPALAWTAYEAVIITAIASALYLIPRTRSRRWDLLAGASAELGAVFCALTLISGSIWGKPTWGVWWTWDARLTTTALLYVLLLGYLALRRLPSDGAVRAKRCAVAALVAAADVPIVHLSVEWWRTLHQGRTLLRPDPTIGGSQLWTMLLGFLALTLAFAWMLIRRYQVEKLQARKDDEVFETALTERRGQASVGRVPVGAAR
jgi:heme exporter protein C